jgi:hypothetical protein
MKASAPQQVGQSAPGAPTASGQARQRAGNSASSSSDPTRPAGLANRARAVEVSIESFETQRPARVNAGLRLAAKKAMGSCGSTPIGKSFECASPHPEESVPASVSKNDWHDISRADVR